LGGGETDVIEFQAPPAGEYEFLCSFPGHYAMMRGKFVVK
jgi:azurin